MTKVEINGGIRWGRGRGRRQRRERGREGRKVTKKLHITIANSASGSLFDNEKPEVSFYS